MVKPVKPGRNPDGTFAPGNSANPAGKPKGCRHRTTLAVEALLQGEARKLTRQAITRALQGDTTALKLCLDRIAPVPKERPVTFDLPAVREAKDHAPAIAAALEATAKGELTPSEAQAFVSLIEQHRRSIELVELEARIAALEGA